MTFNLGAEVAKATADYLSDRAIPGVDFEIPASIKKTLKPEETLALAASVPVLLSRNYVAASHEERAEMTRNYMEACKEIQRLAVKLQREREGK